jgi:RIO-like serine/threonine protein kinase
VGKVADKIKLTAPESKVLRALVAAYDHDGFGYLNFKLIARRARMARKEIRRACRSLARKGLAEYGRGLWTEDGEVAGSGYCCKPAGRAHLASSGKRD